MAIDALFIGWGSVVRGREATSLKVFEETLEFWEKARQDGRIDDFAPYLLQPHGGGLGGFMLVFGVRAKLEELRSSDDFTRVIARAGQVVDELGVVSAYGGESLGKQLHEFQEAANDLG